MSALPNDYDLAYLLFQKVRIVDNDEGRFVHVDDIAQMLAHLDTWVKSLSGPNNPGVDLMRQLLGAERTVLRQWTEQR